MIEVLLGVSLNSTGWLNSLIGCCFFPPTKGQVLPLVDQASCEWPSEYAKWPPWGTLTVGGQVRAVT